MRHAVVLAVALLKTLQGLAQQPPAADWKLSLGPAALEARHSHASVDVLTLGEGAQRIYAFLPAEPALHGAVPVVFFHHGWQGMNPKNYGALIDHLAREGNVVLFPVYQATDSTSPQTVAAATASAERSALAALQARYGLTADPRKVVYYGYSMGAAISLDLAVHAAGDHLPLPQALVLAAPGDAYHVAKGADAKSIIPALEALPPTLPVAILTGADDAAIGLPTGRKLRAQLCDGRRSERTVLLVLPGGTNDGRKVGAGHAAPGAPDTRYDFDLATPADKIPTHIAGHAGFEPSASLNQLDFFGFWKVLDAVIDSLATTPSTSASYAPPAVVFQAGNPAQTYLGIWPDGSLYPPARVEDPCVRR